MCVLVSMVTLREGTYTYVLLVTDSGSLKRSGRVAGSNPRSDREYVAARVSQELLALMSVSYCHCALKKGT